MWLSRVVETLHDLPSPTIVTRQEGDGLEHAIAGLHHESRPLVWLSIDSIGHSPIALGDRLADAVEVAFGAPLFGRNVSYDYGLSVLRRHLPLLGPVTVVVSDAASDGGFCSDVVRACGPWSRILLLSSEPDRVALAVPAHTVRSDAFLVREDEALEIGRGLSAEVVSLALKHALGRYGRFIAAVNAALGISQAPLPAAPGELVSEAAVRTDLRGLLSAYQRRGRWVQALHMAVDVFPDSAPESVSPACSRLFDDGLFEYVWGLLSRLPASIRRHPDVAYWRFSAGVATNRLIEAISEARSILEIHDAPELRAAVAVAVPGPDLEARTREALDASRSPTTLRSRGFALEFSGRSGEACDLYQEALRLSEEMSMSHLVVACAVDLSNLEIGRGMYSAAASWAAWALEQYNRRGLREELRRLSAIGSLAYADLLLGRTSEAQDLLDSLEVPDSFAGIPTMEGIMSTLGDYCLVQNQPSAAVKWYEQIYRAAPISLQGPATVDLVRGLLEAGQQSDAVRVATQTYAILRTSTRLSRGLSSLALGIALEDSGDPDAARYLVDAQADLAESSQAPRHAQACMWLARHHLRFGDRDAGIAALKHAEHEIAQLGDSGWRLLGGQLPAIKDLQGLLLGGEMPASIRCLGRSVLVRAGEETALGLRSAELIVVLALSDRGLSAADLSFRLYGDHGNASRLKAAILRLRRIIPIDARPYRISCRFEADFLQALRHLSEGRIHAALSLYRGPLLPESEAPAVVEAREHLEESLRQAVLASRDAEALIHLATRSDGDLELWEEASRWLSSNDPRRPLVNARIRRIRQSWA